MPERSAVEIFNDALQRQPEEWPGFLDTACAGDAALRAEVASLLGVFQRHPPPESAGPEDSIPERVGRYPILGEVGRGGMGRVYLAEDPVLGRRIALKLLSVRRFDPSEPLARFHREAQILASLNHPNVATLYSLEEAGGVPFLTMELVAGESLAAHVAALPDGAGVDPREVVRIGLQMASGLEAAHERGIVHRDLKPANVILTARGEVKLLDFGVAKILGAEEGRPAGERNVVTAEPGIAGAGTIAGTRGGATAGVSSARSADLPPPGRSIGQRGAIDETVPGGVLGSPGYMSPEQLQGRVVGPSSDIWALGCVLFECLAGRPAFPGATPLARAQATRTGGPEWTALPPKLPPRVHRLLRGCLAIDPAARISTAGQVRRELEAIATDLGMAAGPRPPWRHLRRPALAGLVLAVLAGATGLVVVLRENETRRLPASPGEALGGLRQVTFVGDVASFDLSPDDRQIAYTNTTGALVLQDLAEGTQRVFREETRLAEPHWSPDGTRILTSAEVDRKDWAARIVHLDDGRIVPIGPENCRGMGWTPDGSAIVGATLDRSGRNTRWILIDAGTGDTTSILLGFDGRHFRGLRYSPDGRHVVVWGTSQGGTPSGWIMERLGRPVRRLSLVRDPAWFGWSRNGREIHALTFARNVPWLERIRMPRGEEESIAPLSSIECGVRLKEFAGFRHSDRAIYSIAGNLSTLWLLDRGNDGRWSRRRLLSGTPDLTHPRLSPDGAQVAVGRTEGDQSEIVVLSLADGTLRRFAAGPSPVRWTAWSPDGSCLVYQAGTGIESGLHRLQIASGAGEPLRNDGCHGYVYWHPDRRIRYQPVAEADQDYIFLDPQTRGEERLFSGPSKGTAFQSSISPDGEWMVVSGNRNGHPGVALWLVRMSDRSERLLWSERSAPVGWSADGGSVFAVRPLPAESRDDVERNQVVSLDWRSGVTKEITELPEGDLVYWSDVDVAPAGDRIVARIARTGADLWLAERPVPWR